MAQKIKTPGLYRELLSEMAYHADPVIKPSLSSSVARILIDKTPRHAWVAHPRLNPDYEPEVSTKFDLGSVGHTYMLRDVGGVRVVDAADWRTKAAKEARDEARENCQTPILVGQMDEVQKMVAAGREQIAMLDDEADRRAFVQGTGRAEQTLVWKEGEVWCRARLDWEPDLRDVFHDYKTTSASAEPETWARTLYGFGGDVQAGFYRRGLRAVLGIELPEWRFIVQEIKAPYALSVVALGAGALDMAERKAKWAIDTWARCMAEDKWPGYPSKPYYIDPPSYEETRWCAREDQHTAAREAGIDMFKLALDWQAPLDLGERK